MLASAKAVGTSIRDPNSCLIEITQPCDVDVHANANCVRYSELALRLFCSAALHAGRLGFEAVAYEFIARAFNLYEEIAKADAQFQSITLIIATLQNATFFTTENYDTLVSKSAQVSSSFLR